MRKAVFCLFIGVFVAWCGGFFLFARHINSYDVDTVTKTDAIIVLTGGKNRISEGIRLLNNNMADTLFISGVPEDISVAEIEDKAQFYANDENKIVLGRKATNTIENASETIEWIEQNDIKSIRLVTSNYHIPRSLQEFIAYNTFGQNVKVVLNPIYSPNVSIKWWKNRGTLKLLITEYNKFLFVYICRRFQKL
jgi:uncharacterized SAM-binding protein YcdF (DUF218 family)